MKKIFIFLLILVFCFFIFIVAGNIILKNKIENYIQIVTGFDFEIGSMHYNFLNTYVRINDLRIYNSRALGSDVFANIPELVIRFDVITSLRKRRVHLEEVFVHIVDLNIVKNEAGDVNVYHLAPFREDTQRTADGTGNDIQNEDLNVTIDCVILTLKNVSFVDYSTYGIKREFKLDIKEQKYRSVQTLNWIPQIVVFKILYNTPLHKEVDIDVDSLKDELRSTYKSVGSVHQRT